MHLFGRRDFKSREDDSIILIHQFSNCIYAIDIAVIGQANYFDPFFKTDAQKLLIILIFGHPMICAPVSDIIGRIHL